jgi:hypothetical protein
MSVIAILSTRQFVTCCLAILLLIAVCDQAAGRSQEDLVRSRTDELRELHSEILGSQDPDIKDGKIRYRAEIRSNPEGREITVTEWETVTEDSDHELSAGRPDSNASGEVQQQSVASESGGVSCTNTLPYGGVVMRNGSRPAPREDSVGHDVGASGRNEPMRQQQFETDATSGFTPSWLDTRGPDNRQETKESDK